MSVGSVHGPTSIFPSICFFMKYIKVFNINNCKFLCKFQMVRYSNNSYTVDDLSKNPLPFKPKV